MQTFTSNENFRRFHGHHATKKSVTAYFKQNHFKIFFRLVYIQIFERLETSKDFAGLRFRKWPGNYDFCGYNLKWKTKNSRNFLPTKLSTNNVSWNISISCKLMYLRNLFCQILDFIVRIFQIVELNLEFLFMDVFAYICQFFWTKRINVFINILPCRVWCSQLS